MQVNFILISFIKKNKFQILKFIIAGCIASAINYFVYSSIYFVFRSIVLSTLLGYSTGLLLSFILAKIWVFKDKSEMKVFKSFEYFIFIYILGGIEMLLVILFLDKMFVDYRLAWFFGASLASLNNYLGSKYFLFER